MVSASTQRWIAVGLFLGVLTVGWGVAGILPVMDFGEATFYEATPINVTQEGSRNVSGSENLRRGVLVIEIIVVTVFVGTWAYAHFTKKVNIFKLMATDLGVTIQLVLVLVVLFFLYNLLNQHGDRIFLYKFWEAVWDDSIGFFGGGGADEDAPGTTSSRQWIVIAGLAAVFLVLFWGATLMARRWEAWRAAALPEPRPSRDARLLTRIQETIVELEEGGDVDVVIMRCYLGLSDLAASHGVVEEDTMTPREFRDLVVEQTEIETEEIAGLIDLFERARYGRIPLSERDRREALHHLYVLRDALGGGE